MRTTLPLVLSLSLASLACQSTTEPRVVEADAAQRDTLFAAVRGLEGRWVAESRGGEAPVHVFSVGSGGSAVREIMFPGAPHEMTNMYTLDGNALVMTHYCAAGNQPHMRADAIEGGRIVFHTDGVSDLKSADEPYMGEMTLVLVDADHVEQHWSNFKSGEVDHETVFKLTRAH